MLRASSTSGDDSAHAANLVARMAMGRREALEALYALYVDRVHAVALRILQRPEDAEEVVLDTFSQAWERAALYVPERGEVAAWLLNIARSRALDRLRAERRHRALLPLHPEDVSEPYPEHADDPSQRLFDQLDADSALRVVRHELSEAQQRMIALAFLEDLSHAEIAERTGLPLGTVKSHLKRGLQRLARALGLTSDAGGGAP